MTSTNAYAIEVQGRSAGIVVADRGGYTFFVSDWEFRDLDRRNFRSVPQAERAAARLVALRHQTGHHARRPAALGRHPD